RAEDGGALVQRMEDFLVPDGRHMLEIAVDDADGGGACAHGGQHVAMGRRRPDGDRVAAEVGGIGQAGAGKKDLHGVPNSMRERARGPAAWRRAPSGFSSAGTIILTTETGSAVSPSG